MLAATRILRASWSSTLRLPKSPFPPRPLPTATPKYLRQCTDDFYEWQQSEQSRNVFILHDGPPYANGPLHIGHALNKITKDFISRFQVGQGRRVSYIPGWDCHGLPIEIKALQAIQRDQADTDAVSVREAARQLASRTIEEQKKGFKEWAVMGDWNSAYRTMERNFEIRQLQVFQRMFEEGLIYRQFKPVYWSPSSRTALAEAELEYDEGHQSLAAFVRFPLQLSKELRDDLLEDIDGELNGVIWTTTPWTLPANKAIAIHKDLEYCIVQDTNGTDELSFVAKSRVAEYSKALGRKFVVILPSIKGSKLVGQLHYCNPFHPPGFLSPVLHADFVTDSSGTGLVHLAPGHGMDDYHVCNALGISAFAPVDDSGAFTEDAAPAMPNLLKGLSVADAKKTGSNAVCNYLAQLDLLRGRHTYRHKFPIDWRTKEPVIVRATQQWFADVEGIKSASLEAISKVNFIPETGRSRLESFIQGRNQWCISRQRAWGVPIPALYRLDDAGKTGDAIMDSESIQHIIDVIRQRGIDAWWIDPVDEAAWRPGHVQGNFVRGRDTMDVWFDSGTSWTLLSPREEGSVADVYLEGTDQHRGWFQSSLLTHVATQSSEPGAVKAPYETLITHGFALDAQGRKMSKSLGNVISPSQIMSGELLGPVKRKKQKGKNLKPDNSQDKTPTYDALGTDALRLWVGSSDYTRDVTIGQPILASVNQVLHKYRVTFKWLLGVFSLPSCPAPFTSFDKLSGTTISPKHLADTLALHRLNQTTKEVHASFAKYEFFKGVATINKYITADLSATYFETLKDRIYTGEHADCQALQYVLGLIFYQLLIMLSPICPLLIEEVWDHLPAALREHSTHPARARWTPLAPLPTPDARHLDTTIQNMTTIDSAIKAAQEHLRAAKHIGSSLESAVTLCLSAPAAAHLHEQIAACMPGRTVTHATMEEELESLFVVSACRIQTSPAESAGQPTLEAQTDYMWSRTTELDASAGRLVGAKVIVHPPAKDKCPRCWRFVREAKEELCARCDGVVRDLGVVE